MNLRKKDTSCLCVKLQLKELIIFQTPDVGPVNNDHALKSQKDKVTDKSGKDNPIQEKRILFFLLLVTSRSMLQNLNLHTSNCISGGITGNMNVQKYATLQLLWKMRDDTVCYILQFISEVTVMLVDHNSFP
jgi:hypothetical protein